MADLIFLDTETTGLDPAKHCIWEVAWAVNDGPINVRQVPHHLAQAAPAALRINDYLDRVDEDAAAVLTAWEDGGGYRALRDALTGSHVVGSNPAFDTAMLGHQWFPDRPWHHRLIDISPIAMVLFGWDRPQGMAAIAERLRSEGFDITSPDHTAAGDVAVLRDAYLALREVALR